MSDTPTPAPEGETAQTAPCGALAVEVLCAKCGGLTACFCGRPQSFGGATFSTPTPAPASGEEAKVCDLCDTPLTPKDWPNGYRTWYCATCSIPGELRPRLRAAKAEVARLTRELAEAREKRERSMTEVRELLASESAALAAARAEAARLREELKGISEDAEAVAVTAVRNIARRADRALGGTDA